MYHKENLNKKTRKSGPEISGENGSENQNFFKFKEFFFKAKALSKYLMEKTGRQRNIWNLMTEKKKR